MQQSELCGSATHVFFVRIIDVCVYQLHQCVTYTVRHSFLTSFVYNREMPGNTSGEPMKGTAELENIASRPSLGYDK